MSEAPTSSSLRTAPLALWRVAQTFLNTLHALFGGPERIAFQHTLTQKPYRLLLSWVRCGEAMMRRLLLIEAAAYPKPNTRPLLRMTRQRVRRFLVHEDDKPEAWRVSFRCFAISMDRQRPRRPAPVHAGAAPSVPVAVEVWPGDRQPWQGEWFTAKPAKFYSAWPLAERYEALLRVFNNPAPYARRLAKRLHAAPHRLAEILRAPPEAAHRIDRYEALTDAAEARWRLKPNTS